MCALACLDHSRPIPRSRFCVRCGLAWLASARLGLAWLGLAWVGLECLAIRLPYAPHGLPCLACLALPHAHADHALDFVSFLSLWSLCLACGLALAMVTHHSNRPSCTTHPPVQVKSRTPRVSLDLENVTANAPETALLGCLEKLVLSRVAKIVPANSDVAIQAKALLDGLEVRIKDAMAASKVTAAIGADVPRRDDSWRFPNKAYTALCQQALARCTTGLYHCAEKSERACPDGSGGGGDGGGAGNGGGGGGGGGGGRSDHTNLWKLMNLAFAVDEVGGEAIWRQVLEELEYQNTGCSGEEGDAAAPADDTRDPELEEAIDVIASYLGDHSSGDDSDAGSGAEAGAGGGRGARGGNVTGSKLDKMVRFLKDHKDACDRTRTPFSALLFVSTRDLALTTPEMLEGAPLISSFVKATAIVGLEEMTLKEQRTALTSFKDGPSNVLVSTSVCGEGIDVPACALVVCASLPNSGTALVQLRGRIRCEENCR